jgi:hypothetical protein
VKRPTIQFYIAVTSPIERKKTVTGNAEKTLFCYGWIDHQTRWGAAAGFRIIKTSLILYLK